MHPLQRALIEKAGHDNGFEYVLPGDAEHATLASARHPARVHVAVIGQGYEVDIDTGSATLAQELARTFATSQTGATTFVLSSEALLAHWLRRAAALSQALPNQAVTVFEQQVQAELAELAPAAAQKLNEYTLTADVLGQGERVVSQYPLAGTTVRRGSAIQLDTTGQLDPAADEG